MSKLNTQLYLIFRYVCRNRQQIALQQQQQQLAIQQLEELQKQQVGQDGSSPYVGTQFVHVEMAGDQQFLLYAD